MSWTPLLTSFVEIPGRARNAGFLDSWVLYPPIFTPEHTHTQELAYQEILVLVFPTSSWLTDSSELWKQAPCSLVCLACWLGASRVNHREVIVIFPFEKSWAQQHYGLTCLKLREDK